MPLQGAYSASKHAVKGFTDALRMELEEERAPISVTLIKPAGIAHPYIDHAKSYMDRKPSLPPPVYAPENVAEAILHAAETSCPRHVCRQRRQRHVGDGILCAAVWLTSTWKPRMFEQQKRDEPESPVLMACTSATNDPRERGPYPGHVMETSFYTKAAMHPLMTGALMLAVGLAATQAIRQPPRR